MVEVDISAPVEVVWRFVSDIAFPARASTEFTGATWEDASTAAPALGAVFVGRNRHPAIGEWEVPCFVHRYEPPVTFGWVTSDPEHPGAQWWFTLEPAASGTHLAFHLVLGPGPSGLTPAIERMPEKEPRILERRVNEHAENMVRVVEEIRRAAEGAATPSEDSSHDGREGYSG